MERGTSPALVKSMFRTAALCLLALPACLAQRYRIAAPELERLAEAPVSERARHVHIVQEMRSVGFSSGNRVGSALLLLATPVVVPAVLMSEASRFDGWGDLDPNQELLLFRRNGLGGQSTRLRSLRELTLADARWADGANIPKSFWSRRYNETPGPFNRQGFGLSLEFRGGATPALTLTGEGGLRRALGLRTSFSYFPHRLIGVLAVLDWSRVAQDSSGRDSRTGLEVQVFAPDFSCLHVGVFALVGRGRSRRVEQDEGTFVRGTYAEVGALLQVALATRFALQARGGVWVFGGEAYPTFAVGMSIH